jgi:hypothetical protein
VLFLVALALRLVYVVIGGVEMVLRLCEEPYHVLDLLFVPLLLLCHLRLCVAERIRLVCHHGEDHELEEGC